MKKKTYDWSDYSESCEFNTIRLNLFIIEIWEFGKGRRMRKNFKKKKSNIYSKIFRCCPVGNFKKTTASSFVKFPKARSTQFFLPSKEEGSQT